MMSEGVDEDGLEDRVRTVGIYFFFTSTLINSEGCFQTALYSCYYVTLGFILLQ